MNQQLTYKALLKCQSINKRRHKDESKVLRLLQRNLRELTELDCSLNGRGGSLTTATMPPQFDDRGARVPAPLDFKCDLNQRSTLGGNMIGQSYIPIDMDASSALMLRGSSRSETCTKSEQRVPIDVMLHYTCQSHLNAVNMAKAVKGVLELMHQNALYCDDSPMLTSMGPPSDINNDSQKTVRDRDDIRLRSNQKLTHNKQPVHNEKEDDARIHIQSKLVEVENSELQRKNREIRTAHDPQVDLRKHSSTGVKCLDKLRTSRPLPEEEEKYSIHQPHTNSQEQLHKQHIPSRVQNRTSLTSYFESQATSINNLSGNNTNQSGGNQVKNKPTLKMQNSAASLLNEDGTTSAILKKKRGRPPKRNLQQQLPLIIQSTKLIQQTTINQRPPPLSANAAAEVLQDSQVLLLPQQQQIENKEEQNINNEANQSQQDRQDGIQRNAPQLNLNEQTRPSTEKHDSEEKAMLSKEPLPSSSSSSSLSSSSENLEESGQQQFSGKGTTKKSLAKQQSPGMHSSSKAQPQNVPTSRPEHQKSQPRDNGVGQTSLKETEIIKEAAAPQQSSDVQVKSTIKKRASENKFQKGSAELVMKSSNQEHISNEAQLPDEQLGSNSLLQRIQLQPQQQQSEKPKLSTYTMANGFQEKVEQFDKNYSSSSAAGGFPPQASVVNHDLESDVELKRLASIQKYQSKQKRNFNDLSYTQNSPEYSHISYCHNDQSLIITNKDCISTTNGLNLQQIEGAAGLPPGGISGPLDTYYEPYYSQQRPQYAQLAGNQNQTTHGQFLRSHSNSSIYQGINSSTLGPINSSSNNNINSSNNGVFHGVGQNDIPGFTMSQQYFANNPNNLTSTNLGSLISPRPSSLNLAALGSVGFNMNLNPGFSGNNNNIGGGGGGIGLNANNLSSSTNLDQISQKFFGDDFNQGNPFGNFHLIESPQNGGNGLH